MKKIFTLILVAAGTISVASAQSKKGSTYNDHKKMSNDYSQHAIPGKTASITYHDSYFFGKEKEAKLEKINREFNQKIAFVKSNRYLTRREKAKQIHSLQNQRKNEISKVEFQYAKFGQKSHSKTSGHDMHKW